MWIKCPTYNFDYYSIIPDLTVVSMILIFIIFDLEHIWETSLIWILNEYIHFPQNRPLELLEYIKIF